MPRPLQWVVPATAALATIGCDRATKRISGIPVTARTGPDGRLVDVCESTGTRGLTDDDYLRRSGILGRDDRGGGMAMFFATELEP